MLSLAAKAIAELQARQRTVEPRAATSTLPLKVVAGLDKSASVDAAATTDPVRDSHKSVTFAAPDKLRLESERSSDRDDSKSDVASERVSQRIEGFLGRLWTNLPDPVVFYYECLVPADKYVLACRISRCLLWVHVT